MPSRPAKPAAKRLKPLSRRHPQANPAAFFSKGELAAAQQASRRSSTRTPPEVIDAFLPLPVKVGDLQLHPTTMGAIMVLERINSPFVDDATGPDTQITNTDLMALVFVLTRPPEQSAELLAKGRDAFDLAVLNLAGRFDVAEAGELGRKLGAELARAYATIIRPEKKTATPAPSTPQPATASAGS